MSSRTVAYILVWIGLALEAWAYLYGKISFGVFGSPWVWLLGSLLSAGGVLWASGMKAPAAAPNTTDIKAQWRWLLLLPMAYQFWQIINDALPKLVNNYPIDPLRSDVLPSFHIYVERLLSGQWVYAPLQFPGWTVNPTYLPTMWLPYTLAEWRGFDYRLIPMLLFAGYAIFHGIQLARHRAHWLPTLLEMAVLPVLLALLVQHRRDDLGMALELTPAVYYLALAWCFLRPTPLKVGLALGICLLSRYSLTFWLPAMLLIWWLADGRITRPFKAGLWAFGVITALYVLPFFVRDTQILRRGLADYDVAALGQWSLQPWQNPTDTFPAHLAQGVSFSVWYLEHAPGEVPQRYGLIKTTLMVGCLLTAAGLVWFYRRRRHRIRYWNLYALGGLKLYLTIFYAFLYAPFSYLYQLPLMLGLAMLGVLTVHRHPVDS